MNGEGHVSCSCVHSYTEVDQKQSAEDSLLVTAVDDVQVHLHFRGDALVRYPYGRLEFPVASGFSVVNDTDTIKFYWDEFWGIR